MNLCIYLLFWKKMKKNWKENILTQIYSKITRTVVTERYYFIISWLCHLLKLIVVISLFDYLCFFYLASTASFVCAGFVKRKPYKTWEAYGNKKIWRLGSRKPEQTLVSYSQWVSKTIIFEYLGYLSIWFSWTIW